MTKDKALTLALEALVEMTPSGPTGSEIWHKQMSAITAASEALAQPERPWVGLTDAERDSVLDSVPPNNMGGEYYDKEITAIAFAIEAKLKEKNT